MQVRDVRTKRSVVGGQNESSSVPSTYVKSGAVETWGEALADISSLLYLKQNVPGLWLNLGRRISAMRRALAAKWPEHDTSVWLDRLISADPTTPDNVSLFDAAFQYRKQFQPALPLSQMPAAGVQ